jgi:hypothetical protein
MGSGSWHTDVYASRTTAKKAAGVDAFDYDDHLRRTVPMSAWTVHEDLDPKKLNSFDKNVREAFDSDEHPNSTPIAVLFDVTGSMGGVPRVLQQKLPQLHGLLTRKGYVEDPQILFGAIGDATCDRVPLQIGQFESDNRGDEQLEHIVLEGGGGGGNHESYQLAAYYMARHTDLDSLNKRGQKGYLFFIGDERLYDRVDRHQVERLIGDKLQDDLTTREIFEELKTKFEVFFIFTAPVGGYSPEDSLFDGGGSRGWGYDRSGVCYWRDLLGQNALVLEDPATVCEFIAMQLAVAEAGIDTDEAERDLIAIGADPKAARSAGKALVAAGGSPVARTSGTLPDTGGTTGTTRL